MNKFHGFLTLAFVAALALTSCGDSAADNQKRVDDSIAAAVEKQKAYDDSIAKAVVDTTKKVETPATDVKAKEQGGVKPAVGGDKGTTPAEVKPTDKPATNDPKADKGGKTGEVKKEAEKAGNTEPAKTGEKAVKGGKVGN